MAITASIHNKKNYNKELNRLSNKCEALSRQLVKLRDPFCVCGCGKPSTDWTHGVSRRCEQFKFHPINTFGMNHDCHLAIDHSPIKSVLMNQLMNRRIGADTWQLMMLESFSVFKPTEQFYLDMIKQLEDAIAEVQ